jgi:isocitrate/isopropylmalate dehydrogenase
MRQYKIAFLEGDGIGPVINKNLALLLERLGKTYGFSAECNSVPFGRSAFLSCGTALPRETIQGILGANAALISGIDSKDIPGTTPVGLLRRNLKLYADVRPIRAREGCWALRPDIDLVIIREITQGFLSDRNLYQGNGEWMSDQDTAFSLRVITYSASRQIAEYAFKYAEKNGRKKVTALHKDSIFKMTCGTFLRACRDEAALHPSVDYTEEVVDNAANKLIANPKDYDILLTTNLFGDIISDEAAALVSSLAPSVNYGPDAAVYLPINHQPMYKALETDTYDPFPALLCLHMMLGNLGETEAADALDIKLDQFIKTKWSSTSNLFKQLLDQHF